MDRQVTRTTPHGKFKAQRDRAAFRGIPWELTFEQWWGIWEASGKWEKRGKTKGCYVMARRGDQGAYSVGNVFICTHAQNVRDAHAGRKSPLGKGRGWTFRHNNKTNPYQVVIGRNYIGVFPTQAEAEAAYQLAVSKVRVSHSPIFLHTSDND